MFFPKYYTLKRIVQGVGNSLKIQHVDVIQNKKIGPWLISRTHFMRFYLILDCKGSEKRPILMFYF
jgi:hypothetical protein